MLLWNASACLLRNACSRLSWRHKDRGVLTARLTLCWATFCLLPPPALFYKPRAQPDACQLAAVCL